MECLYTIYCETPSNCCHVKLVKERLCSYFHVSCATPSFFVASKFHMKQHFAYRIWVTTYVSRENISFYRFPCNLSYTPLPQSSRSS